MELDSKEGQTYFVLHKMLLISKIRFTDRELEKRCMSHYDFPSLSSLSDILNDLYIPNLAAKIKQEQLGEIPLPAIAYFEESEEFVLIENIGEKILFWSSLQKIEEPIDQFIQKWSGVVLLIEPNEFSEEDNYWENKKSDKLDSIKIIFAFIGGVMSLYYYSNILFRRHSYTENSVFYVFSVCNLLGFVICCLLIQESLGGSNIISRRLCKITNKNGCGNILNSDAANVFSWLSWSDIGLIYFGGTTLFLFNSSILHYGGENIVFLLSCISLIFSLYSIYYQAIIAKEWCFLCLVILLLIWIEFIFGIYKNPLDFSLVSSQTVISYFVSFMTVSIIWIFLKPLIEKSNLTKIYQQTINIIKFTPSYVKGLIEKRKVLLPFFEDMEIIEIGNINAENSLISISTLTCGACASAVEKIGHLVNKNSNIKGQIILYSSNINQEESYVIGKILSMPKDDRYNALLTWYKIKNIEKWEVVVTHEGSLKPLVVTSKSWVEANNIVDIPTIFINDFQCPILYEIERIPTLVRIIEKAKLEITNS